MAEVKRQRILIFSTAYLPLVGGAEVAVKEITDRLTEYDFDVLTARLDRKLPRREQVGRATVYRLGWGLPVDKLWLAWGGAFLATRLHSRKPYNGVWAIMASFGGLAAARFKVRFPRVPYLLTLQEGDDLAEVERKVRVIKRWWSSIFTQANNIQCISTYLAVWARRMGATGEVVVIPNGVDLNKFTRDERGGNPTETGKKIVTASRLVHKNGLDLVIKALPLLPADVTFHIAGVGPEENKLKALADELGVARRVVWQGLVSQADLPAFLQSGEVFIRPSRTEGLGNAFLEAMAVGVPVVGTLVGGIPDFLTDRVTGFAVEPDSPASIATALSFVLDDKNKEQVGPIIHQARQLIEKKYSWETIVKDMSLIFHTFFSR